VAAALSGAKGATFLQGWVMAFPAAVHTTLLLLTHLSIPLGSGWTGLATSRSSILAVLVRRSMLLVTWLPDTLPRSGIQWRPCSTTAGRRRCRCRWCGSMFWRRRASVNLRWRLASRSCWARTRCWRLLTSYALSEKLLLLSSWLPILLTLVWHSQNFLRLFLS
jgi:hypothetical protein